MNHWRLSTARISGIIILAAIGIISFGGASWNHALVLDRSVSGQPLLIPQGPMGVTSATAGDPYWFQVGAIGDSGIYKSVGASVMIRTVYDKVNNDAHSYWVGSILANGAFVQVGYYNGLTTTNQYYCCAWFYEFFPAGNTNSPPIIGPAGSAGPIGSWHTYTMNYTGNGVWSFYMDNQFLGSSPTQGQQYYLGPGDTDSGSHPAAVLAEVAQTTSNTDVIGPAEFKNFMYETNPRAWQLVQIGKVHIGYGATSSMNLANPYSVAEVSGKQNDFLTGSDIPYPGPDECGSPAYYSPTNPSNLWPGSAVQCVGNTATIPSLSFDDVDGNGLTPTWISLSDSTGFEIFLTTYQSQNVLPPSGQWMINQVSWHATNVATGAVVNSTATSQIVPTNVFSVTMHVVGYFYSLPVENTTVIMYLPDSTNETAKTDNNGQVVFTQLPTAIYTFHVTVPYGIPSTTTQTISSGGSIVAKVFSLPELITLIIPPILVAIVVAIAVARKERQRQAMIQTQAIPGPAFGSSFCRSCGQPLSPTANFCTSCGTPRIMTQ
ncbi:MAG TPA: zinc ribbon domain-containing protein [Candidatus Bathyarchaeia archaeon]|nr:zinc ribbon domain-containing protein [Candidatus Bathyarchaeia archaeon]